MSKRTYSPAQKPTLYFIGVSTGQSSIMKVFPEWAKYLNLGDCQILGLDFRQHDEPEAYREAVDFIKGDPLSLGALVTTHKIDLLNACRNLFDELDPYAAQTGEISCISKAGDRLVGHAKDPITSGLAVEAFLPEGYWEKNGGEVALLGAGGSSIALSSYFARKQHGANHPSRITVTNRSLPRLEKIRIINDALGCDRKWEYVHAPQPEVNDKVVNGLLPHSMVVNATGLGKDAPGSPLTNGACFPRAGIAWELNYRGDLIFLDQARSQQAERKLMVEDGWVYFIHGWTSVIAEVFHVAIPTKGPAFDELSAIAARYGKPKSSS